MKLIGYARVSTEDQGHRGHSLAEQDARIKAYARCHPNITLVDIVHEVGSAKDMNRAGLLGLLDKLGKEGIDGIVVVDLDRLTRNLPNLIQMVEQYFRPEKGPERGLISVSENLDLSSPTGRMLLYFIGLIAQWQRERISEHSKRTYQHLKSQNKRFNAHPPVGIMVDPDDNSKLVPCRPEQKMLKRIKEMKQQGCSLGDIARALDNEGMYNRVGNALNESAISKLCRKHNYRRTSDGI